MMQNVRSPLLARAFALVVPLALCAVLGCPSARGPGVRVHREVAGMCPIPPHEPLSGHESHCQEDDDCVEGMNGRCVTQFWGAQGNVDACKYDECTRDADCAATQRCYCMGRATCVRGNCRTDADCPGSTCAPSANEEFGGSFCRSPADTCKTNADCSPSSATDPVCGWDVKQSHFACITVRPPPPG